MKKFVLLLLFFVGATAASCLDCCRRKPLDGNALLERFKYGQEVNSVWVKGSRDTDAVSYDPVSIATRTGQSCFCLREVRLCAFIRWAIREKRHYKCIFFSGVPDESFCFDSIAPEVLDVVLADPAVHSPQFVQDHAKVRLVTCSNQWLFNEGKKVLVVGTHEVRQAEQAYADHKID